ncbi:MAG: AAA family ATPase [Ruminococcus sp.]|nr:AAA family ATPase [Ruminococcus sp.]
MEKCQNGEQVRKIYQDTINSLDKVLVGQKYAKIVLASTLLSDTNSKILLTGNTGVGKTTIANYLAKSFNAERISVTSDMIPSDIEEQLKTRQDLDFLQIDEFNRASGKVQSAFIELFSERQMSIGGKTYSFNDFYVLATQNSADIAGIFNVPQAVYDRFDVNISFGSLTDVEKRLLFFGGFIPTNISNLKREELLLVNSIIADFKTDKNDEDLMMQAFDIIDNGTLENKKLFAGSNIRAHRFLIKLAKLHALTEGRDYVLPSDIALYIKYVYGHRIDQNVAKITDERVNDILFQASNEVLSLKRKRR